MAGACPSGRGRAVSGILAGVSDLEDIRDAFRSFTAERDWGQFHDPKSLLLALVGEVGELAELFQWLPADQAVRVAQQEPLRTRAAEELSDVLLYLVGLADALDIDLGDAARRKLSASVERFPVDRHKGVAPRKE